MFTELSIASFLNLQWLWWWRWRRTDDDSTTILTTWLTIFVMTAPAFHKTSVIWLRCVAFDIDLFTTFLPRFEFAMIMMMMMMMMIPQCPNFLSTDLRSSRAFHWARFDLQRGGFYVRLASQCSTADADWDAVWLTSYQWARLQCIRFNLFTFSLCRLNRLRPSVILYYALNFIYMSWFE